MYRLTILLTFIAAPACKCDGSPAKQGVAKPAPAVTAPTKAEAPAQKAAPAAAVAGAADSAVDGGKPVDEEIAAKAIALDRPTPAVPPSPPTIGDVSRADAATAGSGKYTVVEVPPDVAAIEGRVIWTKDLPAATSHPVPDEAKGACTGTQDRRAVVRGLNKGVEGAIVRLPNVTQGRAFLKLPGMVPSFTIAGCRMIPRALVMEDGAKLRINNTDAIDHSFVAKRDGKTLFKFTVKAGSSAEHEVKGVGFTELVGANGRGWLRGWIHTGNSPYAVATPASGEFRLSSVLAGETLTEVWHPPVTPGGKPIVVRRTFGITRWAAGVADFDLAP